MFKAILAALFLTCAASAQVCPTQTVTYHGDGSTHFDVPPYTGAPGTLNHVNVWIETTSTLKYTGKNLLPTPNLWIAEGGWFPKFSHTENGPGFTTGGYSYGFCGNIQCAPYTGSPANIMTGPDCATTQQGSTWPTYLLQDQYPVQAKWARVDAPNDQHRIFINSEDWLQAGPGLWQVAYDVRVTGNVTIEYVQNAIPPPLF